MGPLCRLSIRELQMCPFSSFQIEELLKSSLRWELASVLVEDVDMRKALGQTVEGFLASI